MNINIIIYILFFNLILFYFHNKLSNLYNVFDEPDGLRKKHKTKVALTGGIIIFLNVLLFALLNLMETKSFLIFFTLAFLIGYFDDKFDISPGKKLLSLFLIILINIFFDQNQTLEKLKFEFIDEIDLNIFLQFFLPVICTLIFINALNMFDGANLQTSLYSIFVFTILFLKTGDQFYFYLLIPLIFFSLLNLKNKSFLGDAGSIILGYLISVSIIKEYNLKNIFYCEEIFLLMFLPGVDMLRLFIVRSLNKKNPLIADSQHIHHILKSKFNDYQCLLIVLSLSTAPFLLPFYIGKLFTIAICIIIYLYIIFFLKN
jgi:UDP-GlcNAc:undecaprenyl-phosphate GlcNAc-1-phosphate transferase